MNKKQKTIEQKRLDTDLWIIVLLTFVVFIIYSLNAKEFNAYVRDSNISAFSRLIVSALIEFGLAGLGVCVMCFFRKESFKKFGLIKKNLCPAILKTILCFIPYVIYSIASGQFTGYHPLSIMVTNDIIKSGFPLSIFGILLIAIVWGFFEAFNYVVIADKINMRYPTKCFWINYGAIVCTMMCLLFHPMNMSLWGIVEIITTIIAIYGMLLVKIKTQNAWGCVFAFCFIWNAL
ncbi:hypothetical protein [Anaerosporobacter faecicola]|uniref:hypothetical protein n=1 Tax=Anaerosporobacter faecicola TaxID=2718714 RepID=UPI001438F426|nr:hypothetical protein [Anaerosporobacter faecicola]